MESMYPNYFNVSDWLILDTKIVNMYNDEETPIQIFKVKIGTLDIENISINNTYSKKTFDIIRWITKNEFDRLKYNAGTIIW